MPCSLHKLRSQALTCIQGQSLTSFVKYTGHRTRTFVQGQEIIKVTCNKAWDHVFVTFFHEIVVIVGRNYNVSCGI